MRAKLIGAGVFVILAATLALYGQFVPNPARVQLRQKIDHMLATRERHIDAAELLDVMHNNQLQLAILDVRDEPDYNLFNLVDSRRLPANLAAAPWLKQLPTDCIKVVVSNDERRAEAAWKQLMLDGVPHVYILAGGINHWLDVYGDNPDSSPAKTADGSGNDETLRHSFITALGCRVPAADPQLKHGAKQEFAAKVRPPKPVTKLSGGCGG